MIGYKGWRIPEGNVVQVAKDGVVLWLLQNDKPIILEVEKITSDTYAGETTYTGEQFILLYIYPETNGTVNITYDGLTKTITDTSGATEPNAQKVFFGTFNGVSDGTTLSSGELIIDGDYSTFTIGTYAKSSKDTSMVCSCITDIVDLGNIENIGGYAFQGCTKITSVTIPSTVRSIGSNLGLTNGPFHGCSGLRKVIIPASVTTITQNPFRYCDSLSEIIVYGNNFVSENGALFTFDKKRLISYPSVSGHYVIPSSVESIDDYVFYNCSKLTGITIPSSVKSILGSTFYECESLTDVVIENGVTNIGNHAFAYCTSLINVTIPSSVESIGDNAFYQCTGLKLTKLPSNLTTIGHNAFINISSIIVNSLPSDLQYIGDKAFFISDPTDGSSIDTSLVSLSFTSLPTGLTYIGSFASFNNDSLGIIDGLNDLTEIGDYAFGQCDNLTKVVIGNKVTTIGEYAFTYCNNLSDITIGANVTEIGERAFYTYNENIKITFLSATPPTFADAYAFGSLSNCNIKSITVPKGSGSAYKEALYNQYNDYSIHVVEAS